MDLPTCPACGQSVLDEDVDECPFCGASMSGKPAAAPAKAAAKTAAATARPAAATAAASTAPARSAPAQKPAAAQTASRAKSTATAATRAEAKQDGPQTEDDPFAVDTATHASAVPLLAQPEKGRRHEVKCPMCETVGYTSTKAAGREVRCANPKCLVPIFSAPAIEKAAEPEPEAPPKPRFTTGMLAGISGVGLVIIGVVLWKFVFTSDGPPPPIQMGQPLPPVADEPTDDETGGLATTNQTPAAGATGARRAPPPIPPAELRRRAFDSMVEASREGIQNRRPLSVRLTAEAYAATGDARAVYDQLNRMSSIQPRIAYYAIPPLVEIGWNHLANGRRAEAEAALNAALVLKGEIAQLSQDPWDAAVGLAALLAALGRDGDAASLLRDRDREEERVPGVLWAQIRAAQEFKSFDIDEVVANSPLKPWTNPPVVAVAISLGARRQFAAARRWAESRKDPEEKADCLAAWAESLARSSPSGDRLAAPLEDVRQAIGQLPASSRAVVLARLAVRQAVEGDQAGAAATLQAARNELAAAKVPDPFLLPEQSAQGLKAFLALQPASTVSLELAAIASAEAARVEALLGKTDEAWKSLEQALAYTRGTGPSRPAVNLWLDLLKNRRSLDYQLGLALETTSADAVRNAFNRYRSKVEQLTGTADARLELQVAFLSQAIEWNLADRVWQLVRQPATGGDADRYLTTSLPWILAAHFRQSGAAAEAAAVTSLLEQNQIQPAERVRVPQEMARLALEGQVPQAARLAQRWPIAAGSRARDEAERQRWILRLCARLVKDDKTRQAFQLLQELQGSTYISLRQQGFDLAAGLATRRGHAQAVWQTARSGALDPVERAAALRGMIVALEAAPAPAGD
ncbi:MAG TPA: hypothetical protein VML55_19565, partial [Planctomycetaceae bacterium]|nr:hypothetical protein [Planctomycetaceae bacterium]